MGCTASRRIAIQGERERERFGSRRRLGKSSSFTPLRTAAKPEDDMHYDYHVVALTSSTYGIMKLLESENVNERLVSAIGGSGGGGDGGRAYTKLRKSDSMPGRERAPKTWTDMAMGCSRFKLEQMRSDLEDAKRSLRDAEFAEPTETINTWELMAGLDDPTPRPSPLVAAAAASQESVAAEVLAKVASAPRVKTMSRSRSLSAVDGLRALHDVGIVPDLLGVEAATSTKRGLPTNKSLDFDFPHTSGSGLLGGAGLPSGQVMGFPVTESSADGYPQSVFPTLSDGSTTDSSLFDPDILATFADAADERTTSFSSSDWCHLRSDGEASTSTSTSLGDDESPMLWARGNTAFGNQAKKGDDGVVDSHGPRKMSFAKVAPLGAEDLRPAAAELLAQFEARCPPGGEDRVVLYLTSLRGIRKTFEDCHSLRMILQSFSVWVDERDVSMHAEFRQELKRLAGAPVPRVFIKGRYIGGSDEVRRLHEDGQLGDLLQGLPVLSFRKACDGCGGVRFVPCPACSGSCKVITEANEVARCPDCNENGLIRCPVCF